MKLRNLVAAGAAAVLTIPLVGCGGASVPAETVMETEASLKAAETLGAEQTPQAALYLTYAREQMARAEELIEEDEGAAAVMMLERAQADAEVAMSLAREADTRAQVRQAMERIDALQTSVDMR